MGYESKVYVCKRFEISDNTNFFQTIAAVDMSKMGYGIGWRNLFTSCLEENDHWFGIDFEDCVHEDRYGEAPKYTTIGNVISWLEKEMQRSEYRRLNVLYGLLKSFKETDWGDLVVVHYGY